MTAIMFYMVFRFHTPEPYVILNRIAVIFVYVASLGCAMFCSITLMWILLGALTNPNTFMPVAIMIGAVVPTAYALFTYYIQRKQLVKERLDYLTDFVLDALIDEFVDARPDLAQVTSSKEPLRIDDFYDGKEMFVRALCDVEQVVHTKKRTGLFGQQVEESSDEEALPDDDGADGEPEEFSIFGIPTGGRRKLNACFGYIIAKSPLPSGVQRSSQDPKSLARHCIDRRNLSLEKMTGPLRQPPPEGDCRAGPGDAPRRRHGGGARPARGLRHQHAQHGLPDQRRPAIRRSAAQRAHPLGRVLQARWLPGEPDGGRQEHLHGLRAG